MAPGWKTVKVVAVVSVSPCFLSVKRLVFTGEGEGLIYLKLSHVVNTNTFRNCRDHNTETTVRTSLTHNPKVFKNPEEEKKHLLKFELNLKQKQNKILF